MTQQQDDSEKNQHNTDVPKASLWNLIHYVYGGETTTLPDAPDIDGEHYAYAMGTMLAVLDKGSAVEVERECARSAVASVGAIAVMKHRGMTDQQVFDVLLGRLKRGDGGGDG